MSEQKKSNRGGRRAGSGRPRNDRNNVLSVRISDYAMSRLDAARGDTNKSEYIDELLSKL